MMTIGQRMNLPVLHSDKGLLSKITNIDDNEKRSKNDRTNVHKDCWPIIKFTSEGEWPIKIVQ